MNPLHLNAETEALLQGYLEETLTPEDSTRLLASLKSQPELIGVLLDGLRTDALIREVVSQAAAAAHVAPPTLLPESASEKRSRREEADQYSFSRLKSAFLPRRLHPLWNRPVVLALAASVVLLLCLNVWYFGPTMGQPVLAGVKGAGASIERGTEFIPAANGRALRAADVLRLGTNASATIAFGAEPTRLELSAGTELKLVSLARGKRFVLASGKLEASAARQRPFHPMIIRTPQAEARVLGTKFSLLITNNATRLDVTEGNVRLASSRDGTAVKVPAGYYAVAADGMELCSLPQTGGLLCQWWTGVKGKTRFSLTDDPRFPDRPDGSDMVSNFDLTISETNHYAVRLCGYVHPPVTGNYQFWLVRPPIDFGAVGYATLMMSPTEKPSETVQIASTGAGGMISPYVAVGATKAPPPIPVVAGRRYYIEARILIGRGKGELSVAWQPPGQSREVLSGKFLSPFKPK